MYVKKERQRERGGMKRSRMRTCAVEGLGRRRWNIIRKDTAESLKGRRGKVREHIELKNWMSEKKKERRKLTKEGGVYRSKMSKEFTDRRV